ncbi:MAG TPA: Mur ligase family protein [Acidimicrobiales bacterium]
MPVALDILFIVALSVAYAAQLARWLRVLQREHYEPNAMARFVGRWSSPQVATIPRSKVRVTQKDVAVLIAPRDDFQGAQRHLRDRLRTKQVRGARRPITLTQVLILAFLAALLLKNDSTLVAVAVVYGLFSPWGLSIKGRTGALVWTRRATTIAVVATVASVAVAMIGLVATRPWLPAAAMVWAVPAVLDVSTRALKPFEERRSKKFVDQAVARLALVQPRVVAITGSYGKTSTKNHLAQLMGSDGVVVTPRSFNNRAGLSRAINENLADGTRVFVAEMGTYGPGEIRSICSWCVPEIAVVTAIGPVHLERMKRLNVIEGAKYEITERASVVIVNLDDPVLARWPQRLVDAGKRVRSAGSTNESASVRVRVEGANWTVSVDGDVIGATPALVGVQPTNLASAVAVALELGVGQADLLERVRRVSAIENRSNVVTAPSGVEVIDDTFNANPASAASALKVLKGLALSGRRVVVTPGLVELGREQYGENLVLARDIASNGFELVIVNRTNAVPLARGFEGPSRRFNTRDEAVTWVRSALVAGDGVLYLNDLPDHYP